MRRVGEDGRFSDGRSKHLSAVLVATCLLVGAPCPHSVSSVTSRGRYPATVGPLAVSPVRILANLKGHLRSTYLSTLNAKAAESSKSRATYYEYGAGCSLKPCGSNPRCDKDSSLGQSLPAGRLRDSRVSPPAKATSRPDLHVCKWANRHRRGVSLQCVSSSQLVTSHMIILFSAGKGELHTVFAPLSLEKRW
ncbi:hypothetical protein B0T10DRAFT_546698 [Thelonectria olida]|uniref:Uncharacterized protein n=1 Tax=Thelonectria olida TaxID=1576542 RepID=A0A9P8WBV4_9HYPO|nr:hypothetical protein B0T10DRAFT_546698 [Thelonectria olida]